VTLQRLVLDYRSGELVVRCLYQSDGRSNSGTKARAREVAGLARAGLRDALEALEGRVDVVGVSGYQVREDILDVALPRSDEASEASGGECGTRKDRRSPFCRGRPLPCSPPRYIKSEG
jgi:hypothetical protein